MANVLVVKSSASGAASVSNMLVDELVAAMDGAKVVTRDVGANPIPHLTTGALAGLGRIAPDGQSVTEAHDARALSDVLIAEVKAADVIVIGAPMYNFGIPAALKSWFDYVLRAGETFQYGAAGPEGLVTGKKVVVVEARAGHYHDGPMASFDVQEPHLKVMLGFIGLADVQFIRAEKLAFGPDAVDASLAEARTFIPGASAVAKAA